MRINDRNQASDKCLGGKVSFLYVISAFKEMQVGSGVLRKGLEAGINLIKRPGKEP